MNDDYGKFWMKTVTARIDHTLLKVGATSRDIKKLCDEAREHEFYSVCVFPQWVKLAAKHLKKSSVRVTTVVGFPLGENTLRTKVFEAKEARWDGAAEVDVVMSITSAMNGDFRYIEKETAALKRALPRDIKLKIILETALLTPDQITKSAHAAAKGGADFIKTSTGYATAGADPNIVSLIYNAVKSTKTEVKASGGIKTLDQLVAMINAGATRIGTSHGVDIANTPVTREYVEEHKFAPTTEIAIVSENKQISEIK